MELLDVARICVGLFVGLVILSQRHWSRWLRIRGYTRGRRLTKPKKGFSSSKIGPVNGLRWGNLYLPESAATGHFLVAGVTGSGKSHVQRLLMQSAIRKITPGSDARALIYDAKGETTAYLQKVGTSVPIYSLNPFEAREKLPMAVSWDVAKDITSPTRANNFSCSLIKQESSGSNRYFADAARLVVRGVIMSLIKHAGEDWTFSDLVFATLSRKRMQQLLCRDEEGRQLYQDFLPDDRTGNSVATSVISAMGYYAPVAALWQRSTRKLSLREWLTDSSILLLGVNQSASATLDVLNEQMFRFLADEIDVQTNSNSRRTWIWIDEARLAKSILQSESLQMLAVKGRSRGACMLLAFQDAEGFRKAAGSAEIANEIIGQCSHKALLRMESPESAQWASKILGKYETIEVFRSDSNSGRGMLQGGYNLSEQRVLKDSVLPSEFYTIPATNRQYGLTGYFTSPIEGARRMTIPPADVEAVVVGESEERKYAIVEKPESDQWLREWNQKDEERLSLRPHQELQVEEREMIKPPRKQRLRLRSLEPSSCPSDELSEMNLSA